MEILNDFIFPTDISIRSESGPLWASEIAVTDSGHETSNNPWQYPLHSFEAVYGVKDITDLETLISAFNVAQAMTYGFRLQDPLSWKSCTRNGTPAKTDQVLVASATGGETTVQLIRNYMYGGLTLPRKVTRPYGTVLLEINGVEKTDGVHFTADLTTGVLNLSAGTSPHGALSATDIVKGGYTYHVPVRFDTNKLAIRLENYTQGSASVPLVEVRE